MKKILSLFLAGVLACSMTVSAFASDYTDTVGHDNEEAVEVLTTLGVIEGVVKNEVFNPEGVLTRSELATMLVRSIYGTAHYTGVVDSFTDVPVGHWARAYIDTAIRHGLMVGYGNGQFGPNDSLTYVQVARAILNVLGYGDLEWTAGVDVVAYQIGLYNNLTIADTNDNCTRASASQMIYNAFDANLVNYYAGQRFETDETLLNDILGYTEGYYFDSETGHEYLTYWNATGVYPTDIITSTTDTIYSTGNGNAYATKYWYWYNSVDINWETTYLFINGVEVKTDCAEVFASVKSATGVFSVDGKLLAIYASMTGNTYVYAIDNDAGIINTWVPEATKDKYFNPDTSTITYFTAIDSYVISNHVEYGFVQHVSNTGIWVNDTKYDVETGHGFKVDDYVKIWYDYTGKAVYVTAINDYLVFNVTKDVYEYHLISCPYYTNYNKVNDYTWVTGKDAFETWLSNVSGAYYFEACDHCHVGDDFWVYGTKVNP